MLAGGPALGKRDGVVHVPGRTSEYPARGSFARGSAIILYAVGGTVLTRYGKE